MPATPFLGARIVSGGTPQAQRFIDATPANQGVTTGTLETYAAGTSNPNDRVIMFAPAGAANGENTFLFFVGSQIFRTDDAGATWSLVHTPTTFSAASQERTGLFIVYDSTGVPWVVCGYRSTGGGTVRFSYSSDGTSWTETATIVVTASNVHTAAVYRDSFYMAVSTGSFLTVIQFTPATASLTSFNSSAFTNGMASVNLIVWDGFLYLVGLISTGAVRIARVVGSVDTTIATSAAGLGTTTGFGLAFVDPNDNNLYFAFRSSGTGHRVFQINGAFTISEVTGTVLAGSSPLTVNGFWKCVLVDAEANIGGAPDIYLYWAASSAIGTLVSQYQWNGSGAAIGAGGTPNDTGGDFSFAMINADKTSEGSRFWTTGQKKIEMVGRNGTPLPSSTRRQFRCYGGGLVTVRIYWGTDDVEYPIVLAGLSSPTSGSISGGTDNINVPADGSLQEVTAALPGEVFGDRFVMNMEVF